MSRNSRELAVGPFLVLLLLVACVWPAAAQISIPLPGTGGSIQIGPQQDQQRNQDQYRNYGSGLSIRVLSAVYGRNCGAQRTSNVLDDLVRQCQGRDYCVYRIDHRQLGDPRPGCAKDYQARFICRDGGNERQVAANAEASGQSIVLDCRRQ